MLLALVLHLQLATSPLQQGRMMTMTGPKVISPLGFPRAIFQLNGQDILRLGLPERPTTTIVRFLQCTTCSSANKTPEREEKREEINYCEDDSSSNSGVTVTGSSKSNTDKMLVAHGAIAAIAFVILFPFGAIAIRLASFTGLVWVHAAFQGFAYLLYIVAFGLGIYIAREKDLVIIVSAIAVKPTNNTSDQRVPSHHRHSSLCLSLLPAHPWYSPPLCLQEAPDTHPLVFRAYRAWASRHYARHYQRRARVQASG